MSELNKKDALLTVASVGTILVRIGLVAGMIGLGILMAVIAINGGPPPSVELNIEPASLGALRGASTAVLFVMLVSLGLMYDFVTQLGRVIDTVSKGDPFTRENSVRLRRMGWLAIIVQLISLPLTLLSSWLQSHVETGTFELTSDFSFTGLALALVLFILARVFAKGAEMREDLEGTV
jgi:hypothetical protein